MSEVLAVLLLAAVGWVLVPPWVASRPTRVAATLPLGAAAFTVVQLLLLVAVPVASTPRPALAITVAAAAVVVVVRRRRPAAGELRALLVGAAVVVAVTALVVAVPLVNVTADSFRYLTVAGVLTTEAGAPDATLFLFQTRGLATGALHGLAGLDPGYLRSLGPLLGIATVVLVWSAVREELRGRLPAPTAVLVASLVAGLLATTSRFVFTAFYLSGHVEFAVWLLGIALVGRAVLRVPERADGAAVAVLGVLVAGLTVLRPEGLLVALVAIAPAVIAPRIARRWRADVLVAAGAAAVVWHAGLLWPLAGGVPSDVVGPAALGLALVVAGAGMGVVDRLVAARPLAHVSPLVHLHVALWLAVAGLGVREVDLLLTSGKATLRNVTSDGRWGTTLWFLVALLAIGLVLLHVEHVEGLLFLLASFVPLSLLLALLRGGPYRIGPGDSLNRMLVHVLPVAVVLVGALATGTPHPRARRLAARLSSRVDPPPR